LASDDWANRRSITAARIRLSETACVGVSLNLVSLQVTASLSDRIQ
jgi:hypothetical protein